MARQKLNSSPAQQQVLAITDYSIEEALTVAHQQIAACNEYLKRLEHTVKSLNAAPGDTGWVVEIGEPVKIFVSFKLTLNL